MQTSLPAKALLATPHTAISAETASSDLLNNASMTTTTTLLEVILSGRPTLTICLGVRSHVKDRQGMLVTTIFRVLADTAETIRLLLLQLSISAMTGTSLTGTDAATNA